MKVLKIIALSIIGLLLILIIGGYIFVQKNFTPAPNALELTESSDFVPILWTQSKHSDIAGLLLPVQLEGIPKTFYVQFDTGSPSTILYREVMLAICEKYPGSTGLIDSTSTLMRQSFQLGNMTVHSDKFRLIDHGTNSIDWSDSSIIRIGTLGADMIDKKTTVFDFKDNRCYFGETVPDLQQEIEFHDFKFKKRRVLIPAVVAGKKRKLLHDSGTSGFSLITNKKSWKRLAKNGAVPEEAFKVKSWKRQLTAFNISSDKQIAFKSTDIDLNTVTYIEGASFMQTAAMTVTGMGGMIGNQIFMGKIVVFDCKNEKYAILD